MQPLTLEWITKAEADFATAERESRVRIRPNYDGVCFHAQQCIEKYLKAILQAQQQPIPRTHDLIVLLNLSVTPDPNLMAMTEELRLLSSFGVAVRYPGHSADRATARDILKICRTARKFIRLQLNLPPSD